jgi:hypothetical protein
LLIAQLYRKRCPLETLFQVLTETFCCEINTLGYPKAALFTFCVALLAYNVLSVVKAALRSVHGTEKIETEVSSYYLADEIKGTYRGMRNCGSSPRVADFSGHDHCRIIASPQTSSSSS